jgi:hypothetical protein
MKIELVVCESGIPGQRVYHVFDRTTKNYVNTNVLTANDVKLFCAEHNIDKIEFWQLDETKGFAIDMNPYALEVV